MKPLVSALCVTNRLGTQDWLRWNVQRQTYPNIDVVIVDATGGYGLHGPRDFSWGARSDATEVLPARHGRHLRVPGSWSCGQLRNIAMQEARGEYFVWFDDDDWQHPERVEWLVEAIEASAVGWAGWASGYLMQLPERRGVYLPPRTPRVINGGSIYRTDYARKIDYDAEPRASDARWLRRLAAYYGTSGHIIEDERLHAIWMRHPGNTSPTHRGGSLPLTMDDFAERAGGWWGTTADRLGLLEAALEV